MFRDSSSDQPKDAELQLVLGVFIVMDVQQSIGPGGKVPDLREEIDHLRTLRAVMVGESAEVDVVPAVDLPKVHQPMAGEFVHEILDLLETKQRFVVNSVSRRAERDPPVVLEHERSLRPSGQAAMPVGHPHYDRTTSARNKTHRGPNAPRSTRLGRDRALTPPECARTHPR